MNKLPAIGARVVLNGKAHARLDVSKGRARERDLAGTVVGHIAGKKDMRALVEWDKSKQRFPESIHPVYLDEAPQ